MYRRVKTFDTAYLCLCRTHPYAIPPTVVCVPLETASSRTTVIPPMQSFPHDTCPVSDNSEFGRWKQNVHCLYGRCCETCTTFVPSCPLHSPAPDRPHPSTFATQPYKDNPDIVAMTDLLTSYEQNKIKQFENILQRNRRRF